MRACILSTDLDLSIHRIISGPHLDDCPSSCTEDTSESSSSSESEVSSSSSSEEAVPLARSCCRCISNVSSRGYNTEQEAIDACLIGTSGLEVCVPCHAYNDYGYGDGLWHPSFYQHFCRDEAWVTEASCLDVLIPGSESDDEWRYWYTFGSQFYWGDTCFDLGHQCASSLPPVFPPTSDTNNILSVPIIENRGDGVATIKNPNFISVSMAVDVLVDNGTWYPCLQSFGSEGCSSVGPQESCTARLDYQGPVAEGTTIRVRCASQDLSPPIHSTWSN